MEQCLQLDTLSAAWRAIELVLYLPWITYAILWILSLFHYDWILWSGSLMINYLLFVMLMHVAPAVNWISPMAKTCSSEFGGLIYNGLYYQWPCVSIITCLSYTIVFLVHHFHQRRRWWKNSLLDISRPWSWWRWLLVGITWGLPPILYVAFLFGSGIQSFIALSSNVFMAIIVSVLVLSVIPDTKSSDSIIVFWKGQFLHES